MENRIDVERMGGDLNRKRSKDILSLVCFSPLQIFAELSHMPSGENVVPIF